MKRILLIIFIVSAIIDQGCSSSSWVSTSEPEINLSVKLDSSNIAILPFSKKGTFLPTHSGGYFADKLAQEMFLENKYKIIDRSKVIEIINQISMPQNIDLQYKDFKNIGTRLDAKYLITGTLLQYSDSELISIGDITNLEVSCRILDVENGDVVGIISAHSKYKNTNSIHVLNSVATKIAEGMK